MSLNDIAVLDAIFNPLLPSDSCGVVVFEDDDHEERSQEIKEVEQKAVRLAEEGHINKAHDLLTEAVEKFPSDPSLFNNRAQVRRLQGNTEDALDDLNQSINLSKNKGVALRQALCQRGLVYRKMGKLEEAREDFNQAASLGSGFAKSQLVELNPYAALCNKMISEVMYKLRTA